MSRYFFNLIDGQSERNGYGMDLDGRDDVRKHAIIYTGEVMKDQPEVLSQAGEVRVEVTDAQGTLCCTISATIVDAAPAMPPPG